MTSPFNAQSTTDEVLAGIDLRGKRILVTGTSAGIGIETARALVAHGATVVGAVRDLDRGYAATEVVRTAAEAGGGSFEQIELDLGSLESVRACADRLVQDGRPFDIVINNAGIIAPPDRRIGNGFDAQFAVNHLGHFLLVNRIASLIADGGRLVCLTSSGHRFSDVDLDDLNYTRGEFDIQLAYARSKTANVLFAVAFDRRHRSRGVRACAVHPGGVPSNLGRNLQDGDMEEVMKSINALNAQGGLPDFEIKTLEQGAATSVWAAAVADGDEVGGRYCEDCHVAEVNDGPGFVSVRSYAVDPDHAEALWAKSEEMVGERF